MSKFRVSYVEISSSYVEISRVTMSKFRVSYAEISSSYVELSSY